MTHSPEILSPRPATARWVTAATVPWLGALTLGWFGAAAPSGAMAQAAAGSIASLPPFADFAIETWRADNGLPQNTVTAVLQTRRGYLWAGTYNGIVQFDGLRFRLFDSANSKGLANSRVTSLKEDAQGTVWIGHDTGEVSRFTDGVFATVALGTNWGRAPIKDFAEDENHSVWAFNQLGEAIQVVDQRIVRPAGPMAQEPFVNPRAVTLKSGPTYVVRNGVVVRFTATGYVPVDFQEPEAQPFYAGIAAARDGTLWVIGQGRLRKWNGVNWVGDFGEFPWTDASVTEVLETSSGRLLVGTLLQGLLVFDPGAGWFALNRGHGLPQNWVYGLTEDREKNLWVGTGGGLALLRQRKVTMRSPPDDWEGRPVLAITRAHDGAVWAATEGAGIYRLHNGQWSRHAVFNPFVWTVIEDSLHRIWAGSWGGGLQLREQDAFVQQVDLIPVTEPITALREFPAGTLWIGTGVGLARLRGKTVQRFNHLGGAAAGDVRVIEPGRNGELWIGTQGAGLGLFKDGDFRSYLTRDGLPENFILSLYADTDGTLWIGMLNLGLCRLKDGKFKSITTAHGLPANIIYHIEDDQIGHLWFNSPLGLFRIAKSELNECADGHRDVLNVLAYGKAEGMPTPAGTGGFTPSGFRAPDGKLWFSTTRGIAVVAPEAARPNPVSPPVWIEEVLVDKKEVAFERQPAPLAARGRKPDNVRGLVTLQPGRRQLDIFYTGLSFTSPDRVQFKYRLEGLDPEFMPATTQRRVTYSFLPPGEYKFQVTACNSDGLWNETGDTIAIVMLPYFWQTLWFRSVMIVSGGAGLALIFFVESRRRLRLKLERIARERELERERARIAQDIHDDLGASLTRIGMLSQSAAGDLHDPPRATRNLNQIYDTARDLTRAMDEIVWAVNPRHDTLESLTNYITRFAHDFLSAAHIRCRLDAPLQMPELSVRSEVRHNLFLAFKETLNNAVKHSGATEVRVKLELPGTGLRLEVVDNGKGFETRKSATTTGARVVSGYGIAGMRTRLEQVGGRVEIRSTPGEGARVELFVPFPAAFAQP